MKVTFLGTGTSQGIPVIGCQCRVCQSSDFRDKRLRVSILIETPELTLVVDTGPDFRQQMLSHKVNRLDAVLFTHEHKDHTAGMDDIRSFNFIQRRAIPIYAAPRVVSQLKQEFYYVFEDTKYPGVPEVEVHFIDDAPFKIGNLEIIPIPVMHYRLPVFGFRVGDFTYITDANYIPTISMERVKGSKVIVINGLQKEPHISHFTLNQSIDLLEKWSPEQAYLTHISHKLGLHQEVDLELPSFVRLAYDGLSLTL